LPQVTPQPPERSARRTFGLIAPAFIIGTAAVVAQSSLYDLMTYVLLGRCSQAFAVLGCGVTEGARAKRFGFYAPCLVWAL